MPKHLSYRTILLIILLAFAYINRVEAQHEFVITINPMNGIMNRLDSIPGVMYIEPHAVLDDRNKRFLFVGAPPDRSTRSLFSIDAITGRVISKAPLPKSPVLISLRNNDVSQTLYGITVASGVYNLISIDPVTGAYTTIRQIKAMKSLAEEMIIDHTNQRIFFNCLDSTSHFSLISVDFSGNLLSQVSMPGTTGLQYDHVSNMIYGLRLNYPTSQYLIKVDPSNGFITNIASLPAEVVGVIQFSTTFNEVQHQYFFASGGKNGDARLFSADVNSGAIVYNPPAPVSNNAIDKDNVIQFRYSNSLNLLYALHWNGGGNTASPPASPPISSPAPIPALTSSETKTYYSPVSRSIVIDKAPMGCSNVKMALYNNSGYPVISNRTITDGHNQIRVPDVAAGIYYVKLFCGNTLLQSSRLFITH
ncbi:MAG: hypothetical protein JWQ30_726 [Sediminibacterium sp.]|nr:hypothetical protein [Sediminibacterium sp.]